MCLHVYMFIYICVCGVCVCTYMCVYIDMSVLGNCIIIFDLPSFTLYFPETLACAHSNQKLKQLSQKKVMVFHVNLLKFLKSLNEEDRIILFLGII